MVLGEVDVGLVLVIMLDVFEVDDHVQGVGQDQQQDERSDEAHQNGWCQEGGAAARRRKFTGGDVKRLNLKKRSRFFENHKGIWQNYSRG